MIRKSLHLLLLVFALSASAGWAQDEDASQPPADSSPMKIDFLKDIYPIFQQRCFNCHGPDRREGDLRLDRRSFALQGGHTGSPIVGGDVMTNAILQRVTADDVDLLMPKQGEPLTEEQIAKIRAWVQAGTPWKDSPVAKPATSNYPGGRRFAFSWSDFRRLNPWRWRGDTLSHVEHWFFRYRAFLFAFMIFVLLAERSRTWVEREKPWTARPLAFPVRWMSQTRRSFYLIVMLCAALFFGVEYYQAQATLADKEIATLRAQLGSPKGSTGQDEDVPRPVRPHHPPRLGGEYYRGNDERSERLFNGGFYRTATMRVFLCDSQKETLAWGDTVSGSEFLVRFEIDQSPFATPRLFDQSIWETTFISDVAPQDVIQDEKRQVVRFEQVGDGRWVGFYPIAISAESDEPSTGVIYLYRGNIQDKIVKASPHYAAEYSLLLRDGKVHGSSELWMGYILKTGNVFEIPEGKIPGEHWFSFRPIPEIPEGHQVKDDKLLGVDAYKDELKKPDEQKPDEQKPDEQKPDEQKPEEKAPDGKKPDQQAPESENPKQQSAPPAEQEGP